ncbi:50S ribosomal protein L22 [Patescibacteria group bacterium]|nr:50S ribosomal protein L22 [Patescibacteria group bacterium]
MVIKAEQKYIRMSPRKVRLVVDAIRGLEPKEALEHLTFMRKAAAVPIAKTIKQAMANAVKNQNLNEQSLRFESIQVSKGSTFKRWRAVSRGRAHQILKRTSHIKVLLRAEEEPIREEKKGVKTKRTSKAKR